MHCDGELRAFIDFVLGKYVVQGVEELDKDKLSQLLILKYGTTHDAMAELGSAPVIRNEFTGFQQRLFAVSVR
jgi:type I restriction enzyme R subunit